MDVRLRKTVSLIKGSDGDCCDHFPLCTHNVWAIDCPACGLHHTSTSNTQLGPYVCSACGDESYILVEGWVDERQEEE